MVSSGDVTDEMRAWSAIKAVEVPLALSAGFHDAQKPMRPPLHGLRSVGLALQTNLFPGTWQAVSSHLRGNRGVIATANEVSLAPVAAETGDSLARKRGINRPIPGPGTAAKVTHRAGVVPSV
ncbi:hypothetical protein BQ8482_250109 [Mesorhizobium delmotii]|uniref:Uncharacterized protein n=1 Tax=Mesorhizobium delmotii TaxID=1631247 RepID=A0A2P9AM81_9HYPH|nr:hypothetical protein BQ8482_250109 [Mesorhizobium delmotii]